MTAGDSMTITAAEGRVLAGLAVVAVRSALLGGPTAPAEPAEASLRAPGASFTTLERGGRLRGCIGTLTAVRPLFQDVVRNALRAMRDPRLPPVVATEWTELDVSVSVLTPPERLVVADRDHLLAEIRPGVDGLLLTDGQRRSTFLPSVWEKLPEAGVFLDHLLVKGGWRAGGWPADLRVSRYRSIEFSDRSPRPPLRGGD